MTDEAVRAAVGATLRPSEFFHGSDWVPSPWFHHEPAAELAWEIFRGHLLGPAQTRLRRTFERWWIEVPPAGAGGAAEEISVLWDRAEVRIFVTRQLEIYGWEAAEVGGVIEARETRKPLRELVGSIDLRRVGGPGGLQLLLTELLTRAVVGTSRLPVTSLESPLPSFSLGRFGHVPNLGGDLKRSWEDLILRLHSGAPVSHQARVVELAMRSVEPEPALCRRLAQALAEADAGRLDLPALFRTLFRQLVLTPFTAFIRTFVEVQRGLVGSRLGLLGVLDVIGYWLRHLARHLTAFDLVTFHNRGANYPDALVLDDLLRLYVELAAQEPEALLGGGRDARHRRRALRQAWLARKLCEGLRVPGHPTSPGENQRVLPPPFSRLPEEQVLDPRRRTIRLFDGQPAERLIPQGLEGVWRHSLEDLHEPEELRELGTAVFLDRPLGVFKARGEVDRTPLLSHEAFSRSVARLRLADLQRWGYLGASGLQGLKERVNGLPARGVAAEDLGNEARPAVVSLADARLAAPDFQFVRTTRSSLNSLLEGYHLEELARAAPQTAAWLTAAWQVLLLPDAHRRDTLVAFDESLRVRVEFGFARAPGDLPRYVEWAADEYLADGLVARPTGEGGGPVVLLPRIPPPA